MSLLRMPKFQRIGNSWESILDFFSGRNRRRPAGGRNRRLMIDPLEERMLLTVSIGNTTDQSVSQTLGSQTTGTTSNPNLSYTGATGTQAVATDDNGDFVVAWTRYDPLIDPETGLQVINPTTGYGVTEANIYARYYTDEVQRITLPSSIFKTLSSGSVDPTQNPAKFSLVYGGNAVQKITISQTDTTGTSTAGTAKGVFSLGIDLNGDGTIDPVTETTQPIQFDETAYNSTSATLNPANLMQSALRALGGSLADVTVTALDSHEYEVDFGDASQGQPMNMITAMNPAWTTGNLPSVTVSVVRQPINIGVNTAGAPRIYVSPTDGSQTALSIQTAFSAASWTANGMDPVTVKVTNVVTATDPNGLFTFDITFTGNSGKTDQPQLVFGQVTDSTGTSLSTQTIDSLNVFNVKTLKEPSAEFRVNPLEPQNPYSSLPTQYDQLDPAVAMDADGDFVITWTSVVPDSVNQGSQTDVFARRFSPSALMSKPNLVITTSHTLSIAEGGNGTFTVALDSQPLSNITVTISKESGGDADLTNPNANPATGIQTLTFTPSNWNNPTPADVAAHTVTISARADSTTINNGTASFDVSIADYATQVVTATEIDSKSLIVSSDNVSVPEGAYNTFTVKLETAPTSDLTVNVKKVTGGDADLTVDSSTASLKFTIADPTAADYWSKPHTVKVNDAEDADTTNGTAVISLMPADLTSGYATQTVNLTEVDNDLSSIMLSAETLSVVEGRTNSFTVALSAAPTNIVILGTISGSNIACDGTYAISGTYGGKNAYQCATTNYILWYDSSVPQWVISSAAGTKSGTYWTAAGTTDPPIGLTFIPKGSALGKPISTPQNVEIDILKRADSSSDITAAPTALYFNIYNWNMVQTVTLSAPLDTTVNNGTAYFYVYAPNNPEYAYQTVTANEIGVGQFVIGNTVLVNSSNTLTVPEGGTNTFTVALTSPITTFVNVSIVKQAGGDADLSATPTLQLGPGDWDYVNNVGYARPITVNALADSDAINGTAVFYVIAPGYINVPIAVSEVDTTTPPALIITPTPALATDPVVVAVSEGGTNTITVALPVAPTSNVTLTITKEAGGDPNLTATGTITFTPTNFGPQTITFHAAADADSINGAAVFYLDVPGYAAQKIFVGEVDSTPSADFTIVTPNGDPIVVVPEGGTNTFTVVLTAVPAADTTVNLTAETGSDIDLTVIPTSLTFTAPTFTPGDPGDPNANPPIPPTLPVQLTPGNWMTPQTVTASAAADADTADGIAYFDLTGTGLTTQTVTLIENDNTSISLVVSSNTVFVPEGGTNTFTVMLSAAPTANVTVTIRSQATADGGDVDLTNPNANGITGIQTLTFTPGNWNVAQTVTIRDAVDADNTDGTRYFYVSALSAGLTTQVVTAMELDSNVPDVTISNSQTTYTSVQNVSVLEGDTAGHVIYVSLPSSPTYDVTVYISKQAGGDASITADKTTLTFTADVWNAAHTAIVTNGNWNTPQAVTFTSNPDLDAINGIANFYISAIGYSVQAVAVTQIDINASPVVIMASTVSVPEGGYTLVPIKLAYQPISNVTVTVTMETGGDANLSPTPTSFTFTSANWYITQTMVLYDALGDVNGTAVFDLKATTPTSEGTTTPVTTFTPNAKVTANEVNYGSTLITSTDLVQVLEGTTSTFTVVLPQGLDVNGDGVIDKNDVYTVTIARQAGADPDLRAIPTTLTFTGANWNVPQTVKILDNSDADTVDGTAQFVISATGYVSTTVTASEIDYVQGVRALGNEFRVNTYTPNKQYEASVSMDNDGDFVVSWTDEGQFTSFFNNIQAQRFDHDGNRIGSQFQVNSEITCPEYESYVSMSDDGHFLITWTEERSVSQPDVVMAKVYDAQGNIISLNAAGQPSQFDVALGFASTAAWDSGDNYVITFDRINWQTPPCSDDNFDKDRPDIPPGTGTTNVITIESEGVYQIRYSLTDPTTNLVTGNYVTLPIFRVNSAWSAPTDASSARYYTDWPYFQGNNQVAMDADGDITTVFDGYGSEWGYGLNLDYIINSDLWTAQKSGLSYMDVYLLQTYYPYEYQNLSVGSIATNADLGALQTAWESYYYSMYNNSLKTANATYGTLYEPNGYMRGEPNGVQFSQFDAFRVVNADGSVSMNYDSSGVLRDVVVNSLTDGHDAQYIIGIDPTATTGSFTIRVSNSYTTAPGYTDITITPTYLPNSGPVDVAQTATAIQKALSGVINRLGGIAWDNTPSVEVRLIDPTEVTARTGTDWDLANYGLPTTNYQYYEITLDDQAHNQTAISLTPYTPFSMKVGSANALPLQLAVETAATTGTLQEYASIGMGPSGNFVVVWTQSDQYSNGTLQNSTYYDSNGVLHTADYNRDFSEALGTSIHFRTYTESTDTAGPLVTDFILTDGTRLKNGAEVTQSMQYLVVTFDEQMMTSGTGSVTNTSNWALMKDGVQIKGGIYKIVYGLNAAYDWGLSTIASNKYEAILFFDGNGASAGITALANGQYQIVALNSLKDVAGNPLGRTGYNINGSSFSRSFDVAALTGTETLVNLTTAGNQATSPGQQAVASDGEGDYVVVWTSTDSTTGYESVYAKMYTTTWTLVGTTRVSTITVETVINPATGLAWTNNEILVASDVYQFPSGVTTGGATASVAMDGDGDFVVTWSTNKNDPNDTVGTSWDVYARMYDATGARAGPNDSEFLVNRSYKNDIQTHPGVAMDADGDFVITWQSMGEDGSGYGVYAQRYSPAGVELGGTNEEQVITFIGRPQGYFYLSWNGVVSTTKITLPTDPNNLLTQSLLDQIAAAMTAMGAAVTVTASSSTDVLVTFIDSDASTDEPLITVSSSSLTGDAGVRISIVTQVEGVSGAIQVNDTTANDQMDPSVAMSEQGSFVITWTGYGQSGDNAWESNIYAKQFVSNTYYETTSKSLSTATSEWDSQVTNKVVTTDDPANHVVTAGTGADGIVSIYTEDYGYGSGVLLADRYHVITAAHVVCYANTNQLVTNNVYVTFNLTSGNVTIKAKMVTVNPNFTGDSMRSPDMAIITLSQIAPAGVTGYEIYTGTESSIIGQVFEFYGYGLSGTGATGATLGYGTKREGENKYEATADELVSNWSSNILVYDFDSGLAANDACGMYLGINDLGLGNLEANSAEGDSGGPCFIDGQIAAIVTAGVTCAADVDSTTNSSFGEFSFDTCVSTYADWINSMVSSGSGPEFLVNQTTAGVQQWSSVALDADGDFVVSWTSYGQDGGGSGYGAGVSGENGVYARRFDSQATAQSNEFKVNTFTTYNQQHSQASMNAAGDFTIVWESYQDRPSVSSGLADSPNSYGIYAQRYARTSQIGVNTSLGTNGEIGNEFRLNSTTYGDQRYPSIALDANGDLVAVWSGNGKDALTSVTDNQGVFLQRYELKADTAGPFVTDVLNSTGATTLSKIYDNAMMTSSVTKFVIEFDENLSTVGTTGGVNSVLNPNNWTITQNGSTIVNGVASVKFGLNEAYTLGLSSTASGKYEAVVTFDGNIALSGNQALGQGTYVLTISDKVQDIFGNYLDGNLDGANGGNYVFNFTIDVLGQGGTVDDPVGNVVSGSTSQSNGRTYPETPGAVAVDADGDHIVVWTAYDTTLKHDRVYYQIFKADGTAADLPWVDSSGNYLGTIDSNAAPVLAVDTTHLSDTQRFATVACDADGDFVVTWTEYNSTTGDADIYARRFNALGLIKGVYYNASTGTNVLYVNPIASESEYSAFRVNTHTAGPQKWSNVSMDTQGDFVITWSSYGEENSGKAGYGYGVYAAKYNSFGEVVIPEFQVNTTTAGDQYHSSAALMDNGWFVVAFEGQGMVSTNHDIFIRIFSPEGNPTEPEFNMGYFYNYLGLAEPTNINYRYPDIATSPDGDNIVLVYQSMLPDGNGWEIKATTLTFYDTNPTTNTDFLPFVLPWQLDIAVNSTMQGDQQYPSVAVDYNGGFVVAWSGYGNRIGQSDTSGAGVFYQRFSYDPTYRIAAKVGGETRANVATVGNQYIASVGSDAVGDVVIVFTGPDTTNSSKTLIYKTVTAASAPRTDTVGAIISDVLLPDGTRIMDNDAISSTTSVTELIVVFDENMYLGTGTSGVNSIINSSNWALYHNGSEIIGAIYNVTFAYNPDTHKYEATVYLSGNGISGGASALASGQYQLVLKGNVIDNSAAQSNPMYTTAFVTSGQSFSKLFTVGSAQSGGELRVDGVDESGKSDTQYTQTTGLVDYGSYNIATDKSTHSLAVDHKGDFAVVWTSFGQDDTSDPNGAGVYVRLYDSNNNPLTADVLVNTYTKGNQIDPSIAMDAVGDFVVTWTSQGQDADGSWGIYAQRFNSVGKKVGGEIQVNTNYTGDQISPYVAMNDYGNFVIVWASKAQTLSYFNDIHAQIYNYDGQKVGSEFRVNSVDLPSGTGDEVNPAAAMDNSGNFVVVWEQAFWNSDGYNWDSYIMARMFDAQGNARVHAAGNDQQGNNNLEFRIDGSRQPINGAYQNFIADWPDDHQLPCDYYGIYTVSDYMKTARNPSVVMDSSGNFIVAWESFEDNDVTPAGTLDADKDYTSPNKQDRADSFGIYYRRFAANGAPMTTGDHNANYVDTVYDATETIEDQYTNGEQINPSLAIDGNGNLAVVWSGNGATWGPTTTYLPTQHDTSGVFVRNFYSSSYSPNIEGLPTDIGTTVNYTLSGTQSSPTIGMTPDGSYIVVWSGNGVGDSSGIFARRFTSTTDTVGPMAIEFLLPDGSRVESNNQISLPVSTIQVVFDEAMMTTGTGSVTNVANYQLVKDGLVVQGDISSITYCLDTNTNKYIATIHLTTPITDGQYQLVILNSVRDKAGNPLQSTALNPNGSVTTQSMTFTLHSSTETLVNTTTSGNQSTTASQRAVASDGKGDYVAAWISDGSGVYARVYNSSGSAKTGEILVSSDAYAAQAAVAMDGDGDFVVTWSSDKNNPSGTSTSWDVFARCYHDALGTMTYGDEFRVNTETNNIQRNSSVAMDATGDFIIVWQSLNQDGSGYGIYAQRYSPAGDRLGGTNDAQLITLVGNPTGTFALHWEGYSSTLNDTSSDITVSGKADATLAAKIQAAMQYMGASVNVTVLSTSTILVTFVGSYSDMYVPQITLDHYDLSGSSGAAIKITTQVNGVSSEIRVNDTTANDQIDPAIAASDDGNFVISWTSYGQDGDSAWQSNIYCKQLVSNAYYESSSKSLTTATSKLDSQVTNKVVTTDNPANHVVVAGTGADGIVSIYTENYGYGSGVLLTDRYHVITAAHVVCYAGTNQLVTNNVYVTFNLATGNVTIKAKMVTVNPNYTGNGMYTPDMAIITLSQVAPTGVTGYDIYTGSENSIIGQVFEFYGYGLSGTGNTGATLAYGTKREGENKYEATANEIYAAWTSNVLVYDFDDGLAANDALGVLLGINDLGLGNLEANSAEGDSGGPCFINGKLVAIVTAGVTTSADVNSTTDSSFGELSFDTCVSTYANWINAVTSSGGGPEMLVNQTTTGSQKWSDVALDANGDFVVTWTSYGQDGGGSGYGAGVNGENGVYARRFNSDGMAASNEFLVNTTTANNQQHSQVAMDAAGDFAVTWESYQDQPSTKANSYGIYAQRYARTSLIGVDTSLGANGKIGAEFLVNTTTSGNQRYPAVGMDANGDFVVVWSGYGNQTGQADSQGVFMQLYQQTKDTTGAFVTEIDNLSSTTSKLVQVYDNATFTGNVTKIVITFDENLSTTGGPGGANSVTNLNNWTLTKDGMVLSSGIYSVKFGLNETYTLGLSSAPSGKYEAVVTLDGDSNTSGSQALLSGAYVLTLSDNVYDTSNNALDGNMDGTPGGTWVFDFTVNTNTSASASVPITVTPPGNPTTTQTDQLVNTITAGTQTTPAVATDSLGEYVVVWVTDTTANGTDIAGQRYDKYGTKVGAQFTVCSYTPGNQNQPDVAMDSEGDFVVVWAGVGADISGVYARIYNYSGTALSTQFRVNQYTTSDQNYPAVAMDDNGDFVVTWTSVGQDGSGGGIYARRFNKLGTALNNEFQVNSTTAYWQENSDVAMDSNGNFVIVWQSDQQDGSSWGIYGQRYNSSATRLGGEFGINTYTTDAQVTPKVAMDSAGDFIVVWSSFGQDGSGYGVYARRYNSAGAALDLKERLVNQTTPNWQYQPSVSADDAGTFVVTWTAYGQDNDQAGDYGIYARIFNADGLNYVDSSGVTLGEFRINSTVAGNQVLSEVAMDSDGDFIVVWVGPDANSTGIYSRIVALNLSSYATTGGSSAAVTTGIFGIDPNNSSGTTTTTGTPTFTLLTPTKGTYVNGQTITITWAIANAPTSGSVSLCYDVDTTWNGNEKWIEIGKVTAANGSGMYTWDTTGLAAGTYYVSGYMYDKSTSTPTYSRLGTPVMISVLTPTFALTSPGTSAYTAGQSAAINWTIANAPTSGSVSLCYDVDTTWNGNEKWIEIGKVAAASGSGTYTWNTTGLAAGTYYLAGYMYDKTTKTPTYSRLGTPVMISVLTPTFALTSPGTSAYTAGQSAAINWTIANAPTSGSVSLCYDVDTTWNGNEKWIEIGKVAAANGTGTYAWDTTGLAAGTYYLAGYMYDKSTHTPTYSRLSTPITISAVTSTFALTSPSATSYTAGQSAAINWTIANAPTSGSVSLCYDVDTTWNGNEKWIEIGKVAAANGNGTYAWDTTGLAAGTYYLAGYMYDYSTKTPTYSRLSTPITISISQTNSVSNSNSFTANRLASIGGTTVDKSAGDTTSLAFNSAANDQSIKDSIFSSDDLVKSSASKMLTEKTETGYQDEEYLALNNVKQEITAIDMVLQDQYIWHDHYSES